jgi:Phosphotransferase enzyme family
MMTPMTVDVSGLDHVGRAAVPPARLEELGRAVLGEAVLGQADVTLVAADFWPASYPTSTISTERLTHCRLTFSNGRTARIFVKEIRDVIHWPNLHLVPEHLRPTFINDFPWRLEIALYSNGFGCPLPEGMRLPQIYAIDELEAGRASIWMEDVEQCATGVWTLDTYARAAHLLGQLAARRRPGLVQPLAGTGGRLVGPNDTMRMMFGGRIANIFRPAIQSDQLWRHPTVAAALERTGDRAVIGELRSLIAVAPQLLDDSDRLPMTYAHGDASPQNLLVPAAEPDQFVVIDPGFDSLLPVGHDLGQLLVGLCHAGEMDPADLPAVHRVILPACTDGLAVGGMPVEAGDVEQGYLSGLLLRSGFTAIPLESLGAPAGEESISLWVDRLRMTRQILDLTTPAR